ncbi:putative membrane protein [Rickettsia amblyommatis str. Ac/Pa]|uniref:Putative membrane protein n=1 Tax=Rickettsia amblyommatis str. Ac/Pa TaxID=1359164 RepID=A0A0F3N3J6_RICAM|nr:putative membrane protein [Rickettsia amblyommatis str. Ac/Pa]
MNYLGYGGIALGTILAIVISFNVNKSIYYGLSFMDFLDSLYCILFVIETIDFLHNLLLKAICTSIRYSHPHVTCVYAAVASASVFLFQVPLSKIGYARSLIIGIIYENKSFKLL